MSDQRAMLDSCTNAADCTAELHLHCCPAPLLRARDQVAEQLAARVADAVPTYGEPERQTWERPMPAPSPGPRVAATRIHLEVNAGVVEIHEAVLAQLLVDAGWERTA